MTVRRRKDRNNRWAYEFRLGGQRYQGHCYLPDGVTAARNKTEAIEAEVAARALAKAEQRLAGSGVRPGAYTLAMALARHIDDQVDSSQSHVASLVRIGAEMLAFFGAGRPIGEITDDDVSAYRKHIIGQRRRVWAGGPRKRRPGDEDNPRLWKILDRPRSASEVDHCLDCLRCVLQIAYRTRDPLTGERVLPFPPEVKPVHVPRRLPTPMPEQELAQRLAVAPPWVQEAASVARLFGLRLSEALTLTRRHLDHDSECLLFRGEENKSGNDQRMYGGDEGWQVVQRLAEQARTRGQIRLITWPGIAGARALEAGRPVPPDTVWRPLKSIRSAWRTSATAAGVEHPHRFHDLRAGYITGIARLGSATITKSLARHASMATTERYIAVANEELGRMANRAAKRRAKVKAVK